MMENNTTTSRQDDVEAGNINLPKESKEETQKQRASDGRAKKVAVAVILIAIIIFVVVDSFTTQYIRNGFQIFLEWIERNPIAGVFAFMGVYFLATVLFIPGSVLTLGSGLGYGVLLATVAVFLGATSGAIVAFLLGRYLLREWVSAVESPCSLFLALEDKGLRIMLLLRLSPIIPFNALNYIAGVTAISVPAYSWAMFGILPGTVLYIFLGATAGSLVDSASGGNTQVTQIVTIVCGVVFGVIGIAATSYYAKKELNKITEQKEEEGASTQ